MFGVPASQHVIEADHNLFGFHFRFVSVKYRLAQDLGLS